MQTTISLDLRQIRTLKLLLMATIYPKAVLSLARGDKRTNHFEHQTVRKIKKKTPHTHTRLSKSHIPKIITQRRIKKKILQY